MSANERKARELADQGHHIRIITEAEFAAAIKASPTRQTAAGKRHVASWPHGSSWRGWAAPINCVAGESHYRPNFTKLVGTRRPRGYYIPMYFVMVREPDNEHDSNAVRVEADGLVVGYLSREVAEHVAPAMDSAEAATATLPGIIRGGYSAQGDRPTTDFNVVLWLDRVAEPKWFRVRLPKGLDTPPWPPKPFEGRKGCPECGMRKYMREPRPGQLECTDCGHKWRE